MAIILRDRVKETTEVTGTSSAILTGSSDTFQEFRDVMQDQDATYYAIFHYVENINEFEVGYGVYDFATNSIIREEVFSGTNGTSLVNFSAGTKNIIMTLPATKNVTNTDAIATSIALGG